MIKRPTSGDTEQDILKMQSDFLLEQHKNKSFEPAAKVVKLASSKSREPSDFAKKRAAMRLKQSGDNASVAMHADDPLLPPTTTSASNYTHIVGNIVERNTRGSTGHERKSDSGESGFPKPMRLQRHNLNSGSSGKSLFALSRQAQEPMETVDRMDVTGAPSVPEFGNKSYIVHSKLATEIHTENVKQLSEMGADQIMAQRQQLLDTMDPDLVKFLQTKRRIQHETAPDYTTPPIDESPTPQSEPCTTVESVATLDILNHPNYAQWPNFDVIEPAKLEWMRDVQSTLPALKAGQAFEARFDWKGVLLPYTLPAASGIEDDRELYLHGADAERPGYSLQELFRLARSKVMQQRISALGAICGLLSIYNQGFYDAVLDVPISKCFFLLRFAFDENVPGILEVSAKALATLLHNDADETLLDFTRDSSVDFREPIHAVSVPLAGDNATDRDVEKKFAQMHLSKQNRSKPIMQTTVGGGDAEGIDDGDDGESTNRDSLNDFHLAEIDLIECLLRTNIVQRINYVLFTIRPDNSTVLSCLKILIRLARSGEAVVERLFADQLMRNVCAAFLPQLGHQAAVAARFYDRPQYLALKLVRCVASYGREWCDRILEWRVFDALKSYIFVRDDIKMELIKLQVEAFRLAKVVILSHMQSQLYNELTPGLLYMLEWCYQFLQFERSGHLIFRQHAAALITLISCMGPSADAAAVQLAEKLHLCTSKWLRQATVNGIEEYSQHMLLATCLMACTRMSGDVFHDLYAQYLGGFLRSQPFAALCGDLPKQSPLLRRITVRPNPHEALPHLHSVVVNETTGSPDYVFGQKYAVHLVTSVFTVLHALHAGQHRRLFGDLLDAIWTPALCAYVERLAAAPWNVHMRGNWFVRNELALLTALLKNDALRAAKVSETVCRQVAFKVVTHLSEDQAEEVCQIFETVLFHESLCTSAAGDLQQQLQTSDATMATWREIFMGMCLEHVQFDSNIGLMVANHDRPALASNWPCAPLLQILRDVMQLQKQQQTAKSRLTAVGLPDADLIRAGLLYIDLLHANGITHFTTATEHLMLLMIAYLAPDAAFLEPTVKPLLDACVRRFFGAHRETTFDFEAATLAGGTSFENLYLLLIDHFQGTSYGDPMFGALVMVPLAQRYAVRWRQLVWSEHLAAMRFVQTPAGDLIGGDLQAYLEPAERDVTQLKYYHQALHSMRFAEDAITRRICEHHLREHRARQSVVAVEMES